MIRSLSNHTSTLGLRALVFVGKESREISKAKPLFHWMPSRFARPTMTNQQPTSIDTTLMLLNGKPFDVVLSWLDRALQGRKALPNVVPDESPEIPILRRERSLSEITRKDLRDACRTLARRFVKDPMGKEDAFVAALLRLAKGFELTDLVTDLYDLASDKERFGILPESQIKSVLFALLDLRADPGLDFWKELTRTLPPRLSVIPVSALLRHGPHSATQVLVSLPDDEAVADSLYIILDQHSQELSPEESGKLTHFARSQAANCRHHIQQAIQDWVSE